MKKLTKVFTMLVLALTIFSCKQNNSESDVVKKVTVSIQKPGNMIIGKGEGEIGVDECDFKIILSNATFNFDNDGTTLLGKSSSKRIPLDTSVNEWVSPLVTGLTFKYVDSSDDPSIPGILIEG